MRSSRALGLTLLLRGTRIGKLLRTVIHDPEVSRAMGINVDRFYLVTFTFGSMLAAIGGAFTAPTVSVVPGLGVEVVVLSFAVVVIGGLGSLPGAALGAVIVGLVRSAAIHYAPEVELFVIYFVMALVLAFRPRGLFSLAEPQKDMSRDRTLPDSRHRPAGAGRRRAAAATMGYCSC